MKRLLTACLLGSIAFAVSAQDAPPAAADVQAETQAQIKSDREAAEARHDGQHARAEHDEAERDCLRYTGSHIDTSTLEEKGKDCVIAAGEVYSREEIQRTGRTTIAEALRALDPAVF